MKYDHEREALIRFREELPVHNVCVYVYVHNYTHV